MSPIVFLLVFLSFEHIKHDLRTEGKRTFLNETNFHLQLAMEQLPLELRVLANTLSKGGGFHSYRRSFVCLSPGLLWRLAVEANRGAELVLCATLTGNAVT